MSWQEWQVNCNSGPIYLTTLIIPKTLCTRNFSLWFWKSYCSNPTCRNVNLQRVPIVTYWKGFWTWHIRLPKLAHWRLRLFQMKSSVVHCPKIRHQACDTILQLTTTEDTGTNIKDNVPVICTTSTCRTKWKNEISFICWRVTNATLYVAEGYQLFYQLRLQPSPDTMYQQ